MGCGKQRRKNENFQEPAPIQLWGGWNGRQANPDLEPEKAQNLEFIAMYQTEHAFNDVSALATSLVESMD